jgi:hypothetical protein
MDGMKGKVQKGEAWSAPGRSKAGKARKGLLPGRVHPSTLIDRMIKVK